MNTSILELIARVIGWFETPPDSGPSHLPAETVRVLATPRQFLCEGTAWGSLRARDTTATTGSFGSLTDSCVQRLLSMLGEVLEALDGFSA